MLFAVSFSACCLISYLCLARQKLMETPENTNISYLEQLCMGDRAILHQGFHLSPSTDKGGNKSRKDTLWNSRVWGFRNLLFATLQHLMSNLHRQSLQLHT